MKGTAIALRVACALALISASAQAGASAFALAEQGASGLGNAYAGAAAAAEDASTVWWNPAGMARLRPGKHFAAAANLIVPSTEFFDRGSAAPAPTITVLGGTGGDAGDAAFVPTAFFAMYLNPRWNFGLGLTVPFGLATEYDPNWLGRFQGIRSEVKTLNINPALSYKISGRASVGFGISYQQAEIDLLTAVNYSAAAAQAGLFPGIVGPNVEGQNTVSLEGDAWGFNLGALFDVTPATRIGMHYRSSLDYELDGTTGFSGAPAVLAASPALSSGNVKLELETPDTLSFSAAHRLSDRWQLLGDLSWWQWSKIQQVPLVRTSGGAAGSTLDTLIFNFDDTWRASIGANYRMSSALTLKLGFAYDQTPVPNAESRTVRLPDSDRYWLSFGARYQVSPAGTLHAGYTYIQAKDADINNTQAGKGTVRGTYEADVHIVGVQYQHSF